MSVISGHPIFTGFHRLKGCQRDPRIGVFSLSNLSKIEKNHMGKKKKRITRRKKKEQEEKIEQEEEKKN